MVTSRFLPTRQRRPQVELLEDRLALAAFLLTNGPGVGSVSVGVDGFGAFGSSLGPNSSNALYHALGQSGPNNTTSQSALALCLRTISDRPPGTAPKPGSEEPSLKCVFLTAGEIGGGGRLPNPSVTGGSTVAISQFQVGGLNFRLTQFLAPIPSGINQAGTILTQTYTITNVRNVPTEFFLLRYFDGDLQFTGRVGDDGGGRLLQHGLEFLYETDTATGPSESTTFVGITAEVGGVPSTGRFEIDRFEGLRSRILNATPLNNTIFGDGADADQFIDAGRGYDVTLALSNSFTLAPGETAVYITRTFFGTGAPDGTLSPEVPPPPVDPPPVDPPPVDPPPVDPPSVDPPPPVDETPPVIPAPAPAPIPPQNNPLNPNVPLGIALLQGSGDTSNNQTSIALALLAGRTPFAMPSDALETNSGLTFLGLGVDSLPATSLMNGDGTISGKVFEDYNGNGLYDGTDVGLAGQTVYLDLNGDGMYQEGELATVTNTRGEYLFIGLPHGSYSVRQVLWVRIEQTFPVIVTASTNGEAGAHLVTLTPNVIIATERNFGAMQINPQRPPRRRIVKTDPPEDNSKPRNPPLPAPPEPVPPPSPEDEVFQQLEPDATEELDPALTEAVSQLRGEEDEVSLTFSSWQPLLASSLALVYWLQEKSSARRKRA